MEDLLSNYINRETFSGDTIFAIEQFQQFQAAYQQLKEMKGVLQAPASLKDVVSTANSANTAIKELTTTIGNQTTTITQNVKAQNDLTSSTKNALIEKEKLAKIELTNAKATVESAKADAIKTKSLIEQEKELERLIALEEKKNAAIEKSKPFDPNSVPYVLNVPDQASTYSGNVVSDFDKAQAEAAMSAAEFGKSVGQSNAVVAASVPIIEQAVLADKELEAAKLALTKASSENNVVIQGYKVETEAANKAAKEQALVASGMLGPYELLNKQYIAAELNAKDLAVQYGIESVEAKEAAASALALSIQLKEVDVTVGKNQRSVGDYAVGTKNLSKQFHNFTNIASEAATALSRIRRQMVGFLVSGLTAGFLFPVIQAITDWVSSLDFLSDAAKKAKEQVGLLNDVMSEADKNAGKEITDLKLLYEGSQDVALSIEERIKAAKKLQNTYPDTFKNFTAEQIMVGDAVKGYDLLAASILKAALASAARTKIETLAAQKLDIEFQKAKIIGTTQGEAERARDYSLGSSGGGGGFGMGSTGTKTTITRAEQLKTIKERRDEALKVQDAANAALDDQIKFLTNFAGQQELEKSVIDGKDKKGAKGSPTMESVKTMTDAEFEIYKINMQRKLKLLDDEVNDEKRSLQERVLLAEDYKNKSIELSDAIFAHEIKNDNEKLKVLRDNYKKSKGTERNNIKAEITNTEADIKIIQAKINDARLSAADDFNKKYIEISKQSDDAQLKLIIESNKKAEEAIKGVRSAQQGAIDANNAGELGALDSLLKNKIISEEEYAKRKKAIEKQTLLDSLSSQLQEAKGQKNLAVVKLKEGLGSQDEVNVATNNVTKILGQIESAQNSVDKKKGNKNEDAIAAINLAKDLESAIQGLVDIGYQKEIDAIQKIIDLNNVRKDQEIKAIEGSTLSAQEKAAQMIILDNSVAANNRKLQREQVAIQIKQAKFDRDIAILNIIENAAIAALKLTAQAGFAGIAAGVAIGVEAAAQIAMVLAKPLPTMPAYKHGKNDSYSGMAIVGDGGVPEYIKREDGTIQKTPAHDTLAYVGRSDIIFPNLQAMMGSIGMPNVRMRKADGGMDEGLIISAIQSGARMTVNAMKKQKGTNVNIVVDGYWGAYITKSVRE